MIRDRRRLGSVAALGRDSIPADLIGYNRLAGAAGRFRPGIRGGPAVNIRGTVGVAAGRIGPCASFDGTNALSVGMYPYFDPPRASGDWTISVDFYLTSLPAAGSGYVVAGAWREGGLAYTQFRIIMNSGSGPNVYPSFDFVLSSGAVRTVQIYPALATINTWYTAAVRYQASDSTYKLDWNGQSSTAVLNFTTGLPDTTGPIRYDATGQTMNAIAIGGQWDEASGWTKSMVGRIENLRFHNRRLSDAEITTLSAGVDPTNPPATTQIILSEPQVGQVLQKNGSNQGTLRISGCLRGAAQALTDIEYQWNGGAWTAMTATVDSTLRTFTGTATISPTAATPAGRQGTLGVRLANNTAISTTVADVGIGYVWAIWGQSNSTGAYMNPQPYSVSNGLLASFQHAGGDILNMDETVYESTGHGHEDWAWGSTESNSSGSVWPRFAALWADRTGYPVMIVNCGIAGASINATASGLQGWSPSATVGRSRFDGGYPTLRDRVLSLPGGVAAVIGHEGETDAAASMPAVTYQGHLETLANQIATDLSSVKTISSLLPSGLPGATAINTGIADATTANANCKTGPDLTGTPYDASPHWTTNANAITIAAAWDSRLAALGY